MKFLFDMNLSPQWIGFFAERWIEAAHWSKVGPAGASDQEILSWAERHGYVIITHDLDFGALLAVGRGKGPSVVQLRARDVLPACLGELLLKVLAQFEEELERGVLLAVDVGRARVRIFPLYEERPPK